VSEFHPTPAQEMRLERFASERRAEHRTVGGRRADPVDPNLRTASAAHLQAGQVNPG
jgi:hypothetical protein